MLAAVDWFADRGVSIVSRSLGSAYDGPGDGTGPIDAVVDHAAARGIVWFNSAGNDAGNGYLRVDVGATERDGTVDVAPGDGLLRLDGQNGCFELDGVRWANDWYLPPSQRTDYRVEVWQPADPSQIGGLHTNPASLAPVDLAPAVPGVQYVFDADQRAGAAPLEAADGFWCTASNVSYLRIVRNTATPIGAGPDQLEIASAFRNLEYAGERGGERSQAGRRFGEPGAGRRRRARHRRRRTRVAGYSSQGPTNDGRVKPDVAAPSCVTSTIYSPCFAGTSASSPAAAGVAALILGGGLATGGEPLAAMVRHLTADIVVPGPDNASGAGKIALPAAPHRRAGEHAGAVPRPHPDAHPRHAHRVARRSGQPDRCPARSGHPRPARHRRSRRARRRRLGRGGEHHVGQQRRHPLRPGAARRCRPRWGRRRRSTSPCSARHARTSPSCPSASADRSRCTCPPVATWWSTCSAGSGRRRGPSVAAGRFVGVQPERWMDSRAPGPLPAGFAAPRHLQPSESVIVPRLAGTAVPADGVSALVVNVTSDDADRARLPPGVPHRRPGRRDEHGQLPAARAVGEHGDHPGRRRRHDQRVLLRLQRRDRRRRRLHHRRRRPGVARRPVRRRPPLPGVRQPGRRPVRHRGDPPGRAGRRRRAGRRQRRVDQPHRGPGRGHRLRQGVPVGHRRRRPPRTSTTTPTRPSPTPDCSRLGGDGAVAVFVNQQTHVIIDVNGYFTGPR